MKRRRTIWTGIVSAFSMAIIILDSKTALSGAMEGIDLCIRTVIPSLFPFLFLSVLLNTSLTGHSIPMIRPIGKLCGIPAGGESLLILGLVGGYPVGAQGICDAVDNKKLTADTAKRMLGFCSNAGPSFIFGMCAGFFSSSLVPWFLWLIQIISAILLGMILPRKHYDSIHLSTQALITPSKALHKALRSMATICGWVILFRVILCICSRWFLWLFPPLVQVGFSGMLELSNGCCNLAAIENESIRFLFASVFLSFGGLCVCMQTASVTSKLGLGLYVPGKVTQSVISLLLAILFQPILFHDVQNINPVIAIGSGVILLILIFLLQKSSSKMKTLVV